MSGRSPEFLRLIQCDTISGMSKPVHITTPWPTPEELAKRFPISKASEKALQALVDEFRATLSNREEVSVNFVEPEKRRKRASAA
jgi:hypothetical protein